MAKIFKNSKQVLAFVFAFAVLAVSLFTGGINMEADACDTTKIVYWDGTNASSFAGGTGTATDPYIIKTAEQLAYCCLRQTPTTSTGKYYKVDDSVKVFVMQPASVVNLDTLLSLDSAEATKDYLTGLSGVKNWLTNFNGQSFNGNFDGNGATIYGLYVDGVATNKDDAGLFPQYDGGSIGSNGGVVGNTCKNIAIKNSYFKSKRRLGAVTGASYGTGYGAKINGIINYDTIAVVNCYLTAIGNINYYGEQAIIADGGGFDVSVFNNCLVRGNYAYNTEQNKNMPSFLAASNQNGISDNDGNIIKSKVSNSISLDSDPFRKDLYSDVVFQNIKDDNNNVIRTFFENVITDAPAGEVIVKNPSDWGTPTSKITFTDEQIRQVASTGFDFKAEASTLDWENVWFMSDEGPELRAFHGTITETITADTHVWECEDCGLKSPGGVAAHEYETANGVDYFCKVCDTKCMHTKLDTYDDPGDCLKDPGTYTVCACGYTVVVPTGVAPGHNLTYVPAELGHCEQDGHEAYWLCTTCNRMFKESEFPTEDEAKWAPFESAVTAADLNTGLGPHIKDSDSDGIIVLYDDEGKGHWYICAIDGGRLDSDSNAMGPDEVEEHTFSNAVCIECGYECKDHKFPEATKIITKHSCTTNEERETKCEKCGLKKIVITKEAGHNIVKVDEVPANDRTEGTKAHYYCTECKKIYADAEGKTTVTKVSLIIPKVLPEGYENKGLTSTDISTTSPDTSDSFASVIAVAALAGAALVITAKAKR